ncbi:hypothetical protein FOL47_001220 [Perkinsus chesapeaki]|uniref:Uncharacterized protein n=1 Tax=Perkinsus chesapeaki TaxID=330153 RepID=A0A7J6MJX4_PERCH|nr:hypothetical protein FOL47_001220 [Perkinsus chesapeaki]
MSDENENQFGRYQQSDKDSLDWTGILALFIFWGVSIAYYTIFHSLIFVGGTEYRWVLLALWLGTILITVTLVGIWTPKRRKLREEAGLGGRVTIAESMKMKQEEEAPKAEEQQ